MTTQLISSVYVRGLFGLYTYRLPTEGRFQDAAILYGENGLGKSTLLRLVFHLLSPAENRGHRSVLYSTPFEELEVRLGSGATLRAVKEGPDSQSLRLTIEKDASTVASWRYLPTHLGRERVLQQELVFQREGSRRVRSTAHQRALLLEVNEGEFQYLQTLREVAPTAFILNAERRLDSDSVADPSDEVELRRMMQVNEPKRIQDLVVRSREIALSQAFASAARWINTRVFQSANRGSTNVHTVYANVLKHLVAGSARTPKQRPLDAAALIERLRVIQDKSTQYAKYELAVPLPTADFVGALEGKAGSKRALVGRLLEPYIESLEGRLSAIDQVYAIVDRFVVTINSFLQDKVLSYSPGSGFAIYNRIGAQLTPAQLSSGEQQLLLLFCYILTARDTPSVFMIDEPEISLNVKWQRQLVQSLVELTDRATTQFIFASHSMELLAQHRSRVVRLTPTDGN